MNKTKKYIDLQVNGYAGIDFNSVNLSEDELLFACKKLKEDDVESILATLITDEFARMITKIKNLSKLIHNNSFIKSIIKGIHIEGPFLNSLDGYRGAHPKEYIIQSNIDKVKNIFNSGEGLIKLFTLAPEVDNHFEMTSYLTRNNVVVSAGHSNASLNHLHGAIDNGLKLFTHLGNGTPSILPRHDNIINRALSLAGKISICFIADGIHIPMFVLKNYIRTAGINNSIIVTDCMAAASAPPGKYTVSHINVEVGENKIVREIGKENLAGSAITMMESEKNLCQNIKFTNDDVKKMIYDNPQNVLNIK